MKLGYHAGYWSSGPPENIVANLQSAERLGFDSIWSAESYGSDAFTPLAWWGSQTSRVRLGTNLVQISARTPAATAMAAVTMDHLCGGRFVLGLGVSGPQVVEGWYGQPYPKPLERTREYIDIVRAIIRREGPVSYDGNQYSLPFKGGTGLGKPLKLTVHPLRSEIPIMLGAEGPGNVALAAEIADGWLPMFYSPKSKDFYNEALATGFAKRTDAKLWEDFEVVAMVPLIINDDVAAAAEVIQWSLALYIGGMGAKSKNFHVDVFARMGYAEQCEQIQKYYLSGEKEKAKDCVTLDMVESIALVGPADKIREELPRWRDTPITTLLVQSQAKQLPEIAELLTG